MDISDVENKVLKLDGERSSEQTALEKEQVVVLAG